MFDDIYGLVDSLVISSDGRVVIENTVWRPGPFVTRRLNESGLAFVRAELAVVGLFDKSQDRKIVHDRDCCGGVRGDQVTVVSGGKTVEVGEVALKAGSYADSAEWDRFEALVKHLAAPDSWIPASGWADAAWRPFHAPTFCMILRRDVVPYSVLLHTADLAWPPGVRPFASYGVSAVPGQDPDDRLGIITAAEAYALAASISQRATAASVSPDDFDLVPLSDGGWLNSPDIDDPDGGNPITVYLRPVSPGVTACQVLR
jgi:hypothetical protein